MSNRFEAFVMFAEMRTGSNYLEATLNELEDVHSYGEVYNPSFMGHHKTFEMFGIDMDGREKDPLKVFDGMLANTDGLPGFRFFHDHDPRVLDRILPDPKVAKIILTRNPLDSYVSRKIAGETGQWRLTDMKHQKSAEIEFKIDEFEEMVAKLQAFQLKVQRGLQTTGQSAFYIRYEDINDVDIINGLASFLGSKHKLSATSGKLKKQNPQSLEKKVSNYDEMVADLGKIDTFDLTRTPNFEPTRQAAVPGYVAAPKTGLLYMPIKGSMADAVTGWLASVDSVSKDQLRTKMNQKDLRQWMRSHSGYRSFTVIRHPLLRAYDVFNQYILPQGKPAYANTRRVLRNKYGLPIPEKGPGPDFTAAEQKAAFTVFLTFLKGNLAGQTGLDVEQAWASQTAILQGMSQVKFPDLVIREEEAPFALPALAMAQGHADAFFDGPAPSSTIPLADIHDKEIEDLAMEAYRRDYMNFGYSRWKAK